MHKSTKANPPSQLSGALCLKAMCVWNKLSAWESIYRFFFVYPIQIEVVANYSLFSLLLLLSIRLLSFAFNCHTHTYTFACFFLFDKNKTRLYPKLHRTHSLFRVHTVHKLLAVQCAYTYNVQCSIEWNTSFK